LAAEVEVVVGAVVVVVAVKFSGVGLVDPDSPDPDEVR